MFLLQLLEIYHIALTLMLVKLKIKVLFEFAGLGIILKRNNLISSRSHKINKSIIDMFNINELPFIHCICHLYGCVIIYHIECLINIMFEAVVLSVI